MNIGYACLTLGIPGMDYQTVRMARSGEEVLREAIQHNLQTLEKTIDYNGQNGIRLFRISSDLIPFGSSPVNALPWWDLFAEDFSRIGKKIQTYGIRVSMHPGQYTVINSPHEDVVFRAIADLEYHAKVLDALGTAPSSKIILHVGGVYGDRPSAIARFIETHRRLPESVKRRVVIENDDKAYSIQEVLSLAETLSIPAVFDNLHHRLRPSETDRTDTEWIIAAGKTWKPVDGKQKTHYSQQNSGKQPGSHSFTIALDPFLEYVSRIPDVDIMLEVKDKNWSALKCINALDSRRSLNRLEAEWARYKYLVLERDPRAYEKIRSLLKDKAGYPVLEFYRLIESALVSPMTLGHAVNALEHVAGYFKETATDDEKKDLAKKIEKARNGAVSVDSVKRFLWGISERHDEQYLIDSYYFYMDSTK
jgi:UV DNA damage endonuclease